MQFKNFAWAALTAAVLAGVSVQTAQANDISNFVRSLIDRNINSQYYSNQYFANPYYSTYPGYYPNTTVWPQIAGDSGRPAANQAQIESNLNVGFANYQQQLAAGAANGQFTPGESAQLHSELNRLMQMRAAFAARGYSNAEVQEMLSNFNNFNSMIQSFQSTNYW